MTNKIISLEEQLNKIKERYTVVSSGIIEHSIDWEPLLYCTIEVHSTGTNKKYLIGVQYQINRMVDLSVLNKEVQYTLNEFFLKEKHLDAYDPHNQFTPDKYIADTVIPWLSEWLSYFEAWEEGNKK